MQLHQRKRSKLSKSDEWELPKADFVKICEKNDIYPILDVCATKDNTKCPFFMTKEIDSLEKDWIIDNSLSREDVPWPKDYARYVNPPNLFTQKYIEKANEQHKLYDMKILMVIPINATVTNRGAKYIWDDDSVELTYVLPTPKFIHFGKQMESARNRYCTVIWR